MNIDAGDDRRANNVARQWSRQSPLQCRDRQRYVMRWPGFDPSLCLS